MTKRRKESKTMQTVSMTNPFQTAALPRALDSSTNSGNGASGASGTSNSGNSSSNSSNQLTGDSFIQLLTAQLQAQDPTNPVDPTTFVTQLVEFNQLQQLIEINQTLSGVAAPSPSAQSASAAAAAHTQSSSASSNSTAQWAV
jgi:flagellar basal-body rod modification protein FlgD